MTSIFVGNLPYSTSEDEVRQQFEPFGAVNSINLLWDREHDRPRGIAFVEMDTDAANAAIENVNGKDLGGRTLRVNEARPRRPRYPRGQ